MNCSLAFTQVDCRQLVWLLRQKYSRDVQRKSSCLDLNLDLTSIWHPFCKISVGNTREKSKSHKCVVYSTPSRKSFIRFQIRLIGCPL